MPRIDATDAGECQHRACVEVPYGGYEVGTVPTPVLRNVARIVDCSLVLRRESRDVFPAYLQYPLIACLGA